MWTEQCHEEVTGKKMKTFEPAGDKTKTETDLKSQQNKKGKAVENYCRTIPLVGCLKLQNIQH